MNPTVLHNSRSTPVSDFALSTPLPLVHSSTPAWNPSSATPAWNASSNSPAAHQDILAALPSLTNQAVTPAVTASNDKTSHVFFKKSLCDVNLQAIVDGPQFKNKSMVVNVVYSESGPGIRYTKHGTSHMLQPEWVTPKFPNASHDHGLLVVIEGEHCGKYVHRIAHRQTDSVPIVTLVVVIRSADDGAFKLTDEILDLGTNCLCTVFECKADKDRNKNLVSALRDSYRAQMYI